MIKPTSLFFATLLCTLAPSAPTLAQEASSPRAATGATHALTQLLGANRLSQARLNVAEQNTVMLLIRQNLAALDPDNRLGPEGTKAVTARLATDIRPVVKQTFASLRPDEMSAALEQSLADTLSPTQIGTLLTYLRSPIGKRYLSFSRELDDLIGNGLARLALMPLAVQRDQMPPAATWQMRQRLLAMSSAANTLAAERTKGKPAAFGIICDLLAMQDGAQLDRIAQRYQPDLAAFAAFQAGDAAKALAHAQARWSARESARLEPLVQQANHSLTARHADWQALARRWQSDERAGTAKQDR